MEIINAFTLQCPKPLMLAKQQIDAGNTQFGVQVDNETAVKNLTRLAGKQGFAASVEAIEGGWLVAFAPGDGTEPASTPEIVGCGASSGGNGGYAVFVGKDHVGEGDPQLGYNLMKMAIYTLAESGDAPMYLLFMNSGVKLVAGDEQQVIDSVNKLIDQGTEVLVCGTCLDFYGLKESLKVGEVSNMYDILERMRDAAKVITL